MTALRPRAGRAWPGRAVAPWLCLAVLLAAAPASAHRLNVFASVDGGTVLVEARFSDGDPARAGTVRVFDARDRLLATLALGADGTARFPVEGGEGGLRVEVETGGGHSDYWILTAADLAGAG